MRILLQNVSIISPGSVHHLKEKDILVEGDKIKNINNPGTLTSNNADTTITGKGIFVSPGWFDLHVNFCDPGEEYKEDIESGCLAAMQGGFTGVLLMPSTTPPITGKSSVEYVQQRSGKYLVDVQVAGTISGNREGKDLSEMYDMYCAGVRVFTDDKQPIDDPGLMTRALLYSQIFGGKIFSFPEDKIIAGKGQLHEGVISTRLGLKGIPSVAEEIIISRDLSLADYTNSPIHFSTISTRTGVELIRKAKAKGMKVTADVSAIHLLLDESSLNEFDSLYKLKPPLRSAEDREALIDGLVDGTIDSICSDHKPESIENKQKEFDLAAFGAIGLETAFAVARTATLNKLSLPELISKFTSHPRFCSGLKTGLIEENHKADMTVFNPEKKWIVNRNHIFSKSKNNPFLNLELTGKPIAVINNGQLQHCK